jgi:hypothetical protein
MAVALPRSPPARPDRPPDAALLEPLARAPHVPAAGDPLAGPAERVRGVGRQRAAAAVAHPGLGRDHRRSDAEQRRERKERELAQRPRAEGADLAARHGAEDGGFAAAVGQRADRGTHWVAGTARGG